MIVLGFDYGTKYIGVAYGQSVTKTASPVACLRVTVRNPPWNEIMALIKKYNPDALIVGLPTNTEGEDLGIALQARQFAKTLQENYKLPVHLANEYLTTWEVKNLINNNSKNVPQKDFLKINAGAAVIIVEQWLNDNC